MRSEAYFYIFYVFLLWSYSIFALIKDNNFSIECSNNVDHISTLLRNYHFSKFGSSMYTSYNYKGYYERIMKNDISEAKFIELCEIRYNFFLNNIKMLWQETPKIPKIIHQIWLGEKPFPEKYKELSSILREKHSDWIYKLWTDNDIEKFNLINHELYHQTPSFAEKANILRYEVLFQYGGMYVDTDFECLKPFDFLHHCCDFYAGLEYAPASYDKFIIGNALIASRPQHVILAMLIEEINKHWRMYEPWNKINQLERSGTRCLSRVIKEVIFACKGINIIFPSNIFYPFTGKTIIVQPETLGIHYWDLTWLKN